MNAPKYILFCKMYLETKISAREAHILSLFSIFFAEIGENVARSIVKLKTVSKILFYYYYRLVLKVMTILVKRMCVLATLKI